MAHQFIKNRDIVLFSFQPWNSGIAFNFKDMAFELARYNRVLFIDRARDFVSGHARILNSGPQAFFREDIAVADTTRPAP